MSVGFDERELAVARLYAGATLDLAELGPDAARTSFEPGNAEQLAARIEGWLMLPADRRHELGQALRAIVVRDHEVGRLMKRLVDEMRAAAAAQPSS